MKCLPFLLALPLAAQVQTPGPMPEAQQVFAGGGVDDDTRELGANRGKSLPKSRPVILYSEAGLTPARQLSKWPTIGKIQTASLAGLAFADYHSTSRGLARGGMEANPMLSCGGQLCSGRYGAINAAVVLSTYAITRYAIPRLPQRWRRVTNIMLSGMIAGRGAVVVNNYRKVARIK